MTIYKTCFRVILVSCPRFVFFFATAVLLVPAVAAQKAWATDNLALGKPYTFSPQPNYRHCADPDDKTQLTDGQLTKGELWTQKGTVGWDKPKYAAITIDLGRIEPIGGVSFRTAAGRAGVEPPSAIWVLVSDDGSTFREVGDLTRLDYKVNGPWRLGYTVRKLVTRELRTRGRFVQFLVIPAAQSYVFTDEVEVFRGPNALLAREPGGVIVQDLEARVVELKLSRYIQRRYQSDRGGIGETIDKTALPDNVKEILQQRLAEVYRRLQSSDEVNAEVFRAILPFDNVHAELFRVQASLWKALGRDDLIAWTPVTWDPLDLYGLPPETSRGRIDVHLMLGEYRASAVNLANSTNAEKKVKLRLEGFSDGPAPGWLSVAEVPWTDTLEGTPVAAALPEVVPGEDAWSITVLPGLTRQAWLTLQVTDLPAGTHAGTLVVESEGVKPVRIPFRVHVYPFTFPTETTFLLGGWSNTDGQGCRGVTPENRPAFLKHCRDHFVNAPWSTSHTLMGSFEGNFPFADDGTIQLDTRRMDDWVAQWPHAKRYHVWLALGSGSDDNTRTEFAGATLGTPEFDHRVGAWISAWVAHLRSKGIAPGRLAVHGHDEPRGKADPKKILAWVRAIRAAEPEVLHWSDPQYEPAEAPLELFEAFDILCPHRPAWLNNDAESTRFYRDQGRRGKELQLYSAHGPARLLDRYSYYRLQAWHCWKIGATGMFFWAFGDNSGASSWNEYLCTRSSYTPLFMDETTVTGGKQMEAIREGVEDFETFIMLRDAVARAKKAGRANAAVSNAELLLNTAAAEVLSARGAHDLTLHSVKDRTKADAVRVRLLEAMAALD